MFLTVRKVLTYVKRLDAEFPKPMSIAP